MESKNKKAIIEILADAIHNNRRIKLKEFTEIYKMLDIEAAFDDDEAAADECYKSTISSIRRKGRPIQSSEAGKVIGGNYDAEVATRTIGLMFEFGDLEIKQSSLAYFAYTLIKNKVFNDIEATTIERYLKTICPDDLKSKWSKKSFSDTLRRLRNGEFANKFAKVEQHYLNLFTDQYKWDKECFDDML